MVGQKRGFDPILPRCESWVFLIDAKLVVGSTIGSRTVICPFADEKGLCSDSDRFAVICPNALGSTYGTTGPSSIKPGTGRPYGSSFPDITMRDVVASQKRLLDALGIDRLTAVVGPSFGGMQALQWAVDYPKMMRGIVAALTTVGAPPNNLEGVRAGLAGDPAWNNGDYYEQGNLMETLVPMRVGMLKSYGVDHTLAQEIPDPDRREAVMAARARQWATDFDANSLLSIMRTMTTFDVSQELGRIEAPVLYVLSRTDKFFPPTLAPDAMARFREAGVEASYFEIDSENGHGASSIDAALWGPVMKEFVERL